MPLHPFLIWHNYRAEHNNATAIEPDEESVMMRWTDNHYTQIVGSTEKLGEFADKTFGNV